jgi:hypothetical protein
LHLALAYQTEIDNLTKRSKTSENAFLNVYKGLAEAPDPYPLLEAAVVRVAVFHVTTLHSTFFMSRTKPSKLQKPTTSRPSYSDYGVRIQNCGNALASSQALKQPKRKLRPGLSSWSRRYVSLLSPK